MSLPHPLPSRPLGAHGLSVPAIGVGMMSLGGAYGSGGTDAERFAFLDALHALGAVHWDDADVYGDTEELLGKWFVKNPAKRADVFLATKFGLAAIGEDHSIKVRSDPEWVRTACASSLKKLQTDYIDLYYCHRVDRKTPIEETVQAMVELKNQGKIRHLGLSEVTAATLRRAHAVHPIAALQIEYSPWALDIETNAVLDTCKELGVAVVAYSPLGRGFLTGAIKSPADVAGDWRAALPRFQPGNFDRNLQLVDRIKDLAAAKHVTSSQLVLAWLRAQSELVHPLFGSRSIDRVTENLQALVLPLSANEVVTIRRAVEECVIVGNKYPDNMAGLQEGETPALKA